MKRAVDFESDSPDSHGRSLLLDLAEHSVPAYSQLPPRHRIIPEFLSVPRLDCRFISQLAPQLV